MDWILDKGRPICPQICEQVCLRIMLGLFAPGERLLSVREIALAAGVNPNTVQKSFDLLEQKGILCSQRGSGWYVSADTEPARLAYEALLREKTEAYFASMRTLGMNEAQTKAYVSQWHADNDTQKGTVNDGE